MHHRILSLALALVPLACGGAQHAEPGNATTTTAAGAEPAHLCPMAVPGAQAVLVDVPGGVAVDYTTSGSRDDVQELSHRLRAMQQKRALGMMAGPGGGRGRRGALRSVTASTPPSTTHLEGIPRGMRLVLQADNPAEVDALRARARQHVPGMGGGECAKQ
jgi:hypothetical protein